jgi:RHS repeat-associated protein
MSSDVAYDPFGGPYAQAGTTDLSFTGQDQDTASSLYDFPARKYGIQGRWPSPDPAGLAAANLAFPQSWNRYAYVENNPLSLVDPFGLAPPKHGHPRIPPRHAIGCAYGQASMSYGGGCTIDDPFSLLNLLFDAFTPTGYDWTIGTSWDHEPIVRWIPKFGNIGLLALLNQVSNNDVPFLIGDLGALRYHRYQGTRLAKGLTPTACSGGGFGFVGGQKQSGSAQGFAGGLFEWDSKSGWSGRGLFEFGSHGAGGGMITSPLDGLVFLPVVEFPAYGVPVEAGALATTSGSVGGYAEIGKGKVAGGVGGYVNIGTVLSCE